MSIWTTLPPVFLILDTPFRLGGKYAKPLKHATQSAKAYLPPPYQGFKLAAVEKPSWNNLWATVVNIFSPPLPPPTAGLVERQAIFALEWKPSKQVSANAVKIVRRGYSSFSSLKFPACLWISFSLAAWLLCLTSRLPFACAGLNHSVRLNQLTVVQALYLDAL